MKRGRLIVEAGRPLRFVDATETHAAPQSPEQENAVLIADAVKTYRKSADDLLKGKYASFADVVPRHLTSPCSTLVLRCSDGVFVRYDPATDEKPIIRAAATNQSLRDVAPQFSENVLRFDTSATELQHDDGGLKFEMTVVDSSGAITQKHILSLLIAASSQLPNGFVPLSPPARPFCLASLENVIQMQIGGCLVPVDPPSSAADRENFIGHSRIQLSVGWLAIEVYPLLGDEYWQPAFAPLWAELDILAATAQHNVQEAQLNALDGRGATRAYYAALLNEFKRLLQGPEEPVHQFLRQHPELICPTFEKFWSKLAFGSRVSDFVLRAPQRL